MALDMEVLILIPAISHSAATALVHVEDPGLMKPMGQHQEEQKAEMKPCDS